MQNDIQNTNKKSTFKKTLVAMVITGLVLLLIGGGIFVGGLGLVEWNIFNLDPEIITQAEGFSSTEEVTHLSLTGSWNYEIVQGEYFSVQYFTSSNSTTTTDLHRNANDNTYKFVLHETRRQTFFNIGFGGLRRARNHYTVRITVANDIDTIHITGSSARVHIADLDINFRNIRVDGSSTRLYLNNVNLNHAQNTSIQVSGSAARVTLTNTQAESVSVTGSSTEAILQNVNIANTLSLAGSAVRATLTNTQAESVSALGSSARIILQNTTIAGTLSVEGSAARATLTDSTVREATLLGSSSRLDAHNSHLRNASVVGSAARADLHIIGNVTDVHTLSASGSNNRLYFNGTRQHNEFRPNAGQPVGAQGFMNFSTLGSNARLDVTMLGGESVF